MSKHNTQSSTLVALDAASLSDVVGGLDYLPTSGDGAGEHVPGAYPGGGGLGSLYPSPSGAVHTEGAGNEYGSLSLYPTSGA